VYVLDWGAGNLKAVTDLAERLKKEDVDNVYIIAFGNAYPAPDERLGTPIPENVTFIVDVAENLTSHLKELLPEGHTIDAVYSNLGLAYLFEEGNERVLKHLSDLAALLSINGFIVADVLLRDVDSETLRQIRQKTHRSARLAKDSRDPEVGFLVLEANDSDAGDGEGGTLHSADIAAPLVALLGWVSRNLGKLDSAEFKAQVAKAIVGLDEQNLKQRLQEARQQAQAQGITLGDEDFGKLKSALQEAIRDTAASAAKAPAAPGGEGGSVPRPLRIRWLEDDEAHKLAEGLDRSLGGYGFISQKPVVVDGQQYAVESTSPLFATDGSYRISRIGPLIFVSINELSATELMRHTEILKQRFGALYSENAGNILFYNPMTYDYSVSMPLNAYVMGIIGGMLANSNRFKEALVFDEGAGDGLLARVALRLGAARAVLIDNDSDALSRARAFLQHDGYSEGVEEKNKFVILQIDLMDSSLNTLLAEYRLVGRPAIALINIGPTYGEVNQRALDLVVDFPGLVFLINGGYIEYRQNLFYERDQAAMQRVRDYLEDKGFIVRSISQDMTVALTAVLRGVSANEVQPADAEKKVEAPAESPLSSVPEGAALAKMQDGAGKDPSLGSGSIPPVTADKGGIDFRALPIPAEGGAHGLPIGRGAHSAAGAVPIDLDKDWRQIENMVNSGIIPSCQRLKEYLQASCTGPDCQERIDKVLSCIADIFRLEEEKVVSTDAGLREILTLLESGRPVEELRVAMN
jgi:hypothetical protein